MGRFVTTMQTFRVSLKRTRAAIASTIASAAMIVALPLAAGAEGLTTITVTPTDTQGWSTADTRANGSVSFIKDTTAPLGIGALSLTTGASGTSQDKAQYIHATSTKLADVSALSYWTKQNSASFAAGLPSYQLPVCLYGLNTAQTNCATVPGSTQSSFTTLVYEPYVDQGNAVVVPGTWQQWNVAAGKLWSSRTVAGLTSTQGAVTYTLPWLQATYPNATLLGFGVNVGSNNPFYNTEVDGVQFNNTVYNFEPYVVVTSKDACKDGGWMTAKDSNGNGFKNQGACVSFVASDGTL